MVSAQCWNELKGVLDTINYCGEYFSSEDRRQAALFQKNGVQRHPLSASVQDAATQLRRILDVDLMRPPEGEGGDLANEVDDTSESSGAD